MSKIIAAITQGRPIGISVIVLEVLLVGFVIMFCYQIVKYFLMSKIISKFVILQYNKLKDSEKMRLNEQQFGKEMYGETETKGLMNHVDRMIDYSNIRSKIPWIGTEMLFVIWAGVLLLSIILSAVIGYPIIFSLIITIGAVGATILVLFLLANNNYKKIQKQISKFINLIENFAPACSDIIQIFSMACPYLDEPLRTDVERCIRTASTSGDKDFALRELQDSVQNIYFKDMIRSLRTATKYESNFGEVVNDCRDQVKQSLKYEQEKESLISNGRTEMLMLAFIGIVCMVMGASTADMTMTELLFGTGIGGYAFAIYFVVLILLVIYFGFVKSSRS